jgi:hypothetical protein
MVSFPLRIHAVFRDGKFVPNGPCPLPEASEVELVVQSAAGLCSLISDPAERKVAVDALITQMQAAALTSGAPKLTRDEMHERR